MQKALQFEQTLRQHLNIEGVVEVRGKGAWIGVELSCTAKPIAQSLLELGVFVGTTGQPNTLRLAPPACMPEEGIIALKENLKLLLASVPKFGAA